MAMTVTDVRDFLDVLRQHPEWRAAVREEVVGPELISLPELVRQNSEDIRALTAVVAQNSRDIAQNSADIRELREVVAQNSADIRELSQTVDRLVGAVARQGDRQGEFDGKWLQLLYHWKPWHVLPPGRLRKPRAVEFPELDRLEPAVDTGLITESEREALWRADVFITGREGHGSDASEALLVLEVSRTVAEKDIVRALARAAIARKAGYNAHPVVAGIAISPPDLHRAQMAGVEVYLDIEPDGD